MKRFIKIFIPFALITSCSSPENFEQEKIREQNAKGEFIYRKSSETFYQPGPLKKRTPEPYPWD